jgi:hypothetical protein
MDFKKDTSLRLDLKTASMLKEIANKSGKSQIQLVRELVGELYCLSASFKDRHNIFYETRVTSAECNIRFRGSRNLVSGHFCTMGLTPKEIDEKQADVITSAFAKEGVKGND